MKNGSVREMPEGRKRSGERRTTGPPRRSLPRHAVARTQRLLSNRIVGRIDLPAGKRGRRPSVLRSQNQWFRLVLRNGSARRVLLAIHRARRFLRSPKGALDRRGRRRFVARSEDATPVRVTRNTDPDGCREPFPIVQALPRYSGTTVRAKNGRTTLASPNTDLCHQGL